MIKISKIWNIELLNIENIEHLLIALELQSQAKIKNKKQK